MREHQGIPLLPLRPHRLRCLAPSPQGEDLVSLPTMTDKLPIGFCARGFVCSWDVEGAVPYRLFFVAEIRSFSGGDKQNSLHSKFALQKLPLPYLSFVISYTNFSIIKNQPVGECLGAPASPQSTLLFCRVSVAPTK